jgi:uncharacterized membrane protein (UPF0127 family)
MAFGRWMRGSRFAFVVLALLASGAALSAGVTRARAQRVAPQPQSGLEPLTIVTASGAHKFMVEVMRTEAERERGLMFRRFLPQDRGMLFDFKRTDAVAMWMKNTYIPLDMIFMDKAGRVTHIARDAEPLSERIIPSHGPVYAVLELNAGAARAIGLKEGDRIEGALFK